jgi:hypothetical protein
MSVLPSAREIESQAVTEEPLRRRSTPASLGEVPAMLRRRGFHPLETRPDLPFPPDLAGQSADRLANLLGHYAFRLFLRGAIQRSDGFVPGKATRYLKSPQARAYADALVGMGLAERWLRGRYRLLSSARSFGGTLEWYVARELRQRLAYDVASGVKLQTRGVGGDFDIIAAGEGKLIYIELKSSPPKNLSTAEVSAFFDRLQLLRPDIGLFVVDTALRLSDKILPMLLSEIGRRRTEPPGPPRRVKQELWALTPHLYVVNGRRDLMANIECAIAEGLLALAPAPF